MQALLVENVNAGYRNRQVLHDISLQVEVGERVLLIGQNGCGKTTLLKVLAGSLRPDKGRVVLMDKDVSHTLGHQRIRKGIGFLMQTQNTFQSLTVDENLRLSFWKANGTYDERREWVLSVFPMLKERLTTRAGLLSGGERQALAIGMVIIRPVDLLLLDEPTAGLSPAAAEMILESVHLAQKLAGFTSVMVEHNLRLVQPWISRVVVMNMGQIVADDEPSMLLNPEKLQKFYFV